MTMVSEAVSTLERAGLTRRDRMRLCFRLEAATLRSAVDLADALRMGGHNQVRVRPAPRRLLTSRRWIVVVTTPPAPVMRAVIELWLDQMHDVVDRHAGCAIVGVEPIARRVPAL